MSNKKDIRASLGLSQRQLADYLDVPCTQIGMWETGRRELPTAALLKLSALISGVHNTPLKQQPEPLSEKDHKAMRRHAESCRHKACMAKRKLDAIQLKYGHCMKTLAVIDHLQNNIQQGKSAAKDKAWLELLRITTRKKLGRCGPAVQFKLKLNHQALEMQVVQAEAMKC